MNNPRLDIYIVGLVIVVAIIVSAAIWQPTETPDGPVKPATLQEQTSSQGEDVCFDGNFENDPAHCKQR